MATNRRFKLLGQGINVIDGVTPDDLTVEGDWTFDGDVTLNGAITLDGQDIDMAGPGTGQIRAERQFLGDDVTGTFTTAGVYKMCMLVVSVNATYYAHFGVAGTQAPTDYGSGSAVSMGAANPDVDGNVNIWPSDSAEISIKNRAGSSRIFTLYTWSL